MTRDARGLPITAQSDAEVASIDWFTTRLARIDRGAEAILEDAKSFPGSPMIQLGAASFCLFGQTRRRRSGCGRTILRPPSRCWHPPPSANSNFTMPLTLWGRKDHLGSVAALEEITRTWPRDLLAAKIAEFHLLRARPAARGAALSLPHGAARGCERRGSGFPRDLCICAGVVRRRRRRAAHRRSRARDRAAQSMGPSLRGAHLLAPRRAA